MRLIFMGTPEFAVPSLNKLADSSHEIVGVVTPPDRPKGRGLKQASSLVKQAALTLNLPITQPEDLKTPDFLDQLKTWQADCYVVVGFRILPPEVYEIPELGSFNLHASLLPKYRGAAPIQWAIMNGDLETGVTTFFLNRKVDTGDVLLQSHIEIKPYENSGELHDRLSILGADIVLETVELISSGKAAPKPQVGYPCPAPKITGKICMIDWQRPAVQIHNQIRSLAPRPGAFSFWQEKRIKIYQSSINSGAMIQKQNPGTVVKAEKDDLWIETGENILAIESCQIEGKSRMSVEAFLRGYPIQVGDQFQKELSKG